MRKVYTCLKRAGIYIKNGRPVERKDLFVGSVDYNGCLNNRKILITGGSKGLGYAIAEKCLKEGCKVVISGRNNETLNNAVASLGNKNIYKLSFDMCEAENISVLIEKASELMGGLDSVVSNAGVSLHEKSWDSVDFENWDIQMETNLKGSYFLAQAYYNYMLKSNQRNGSFIIMTSERGLYGDDIPYGLSKSALIDLTLGLAKHMEGTDIRVNAVAPGVTATEMTGHDPSGNLYRQYARGRRILLPEEIAETTVFLLSNKSKCLSGIVIPCNETNHLR